MPYPVLEVESIKERCNSDLVQFLKNNPGTRNDTRLQLQFNISKPDDLNQAIQPIIEFIQDNLPQGISYVSGISQVSPVIQNQLWIARTYLFYQLLIFTTVLLQEEVLYNSVFTDTEQYPYRSDIPKELPNFKLGIFGSITPTSDIDVGIQYSGTTLETPGLAYIVSRFENLFLHFTGNSSLEYDIETYADMMTIPNQNSNEDYFYLDTSEFDESDFAKILPCAGKSIVRNLKLAEVPSPILVNPQYVKGISEFQALQQMLLEKHMVLNSLNDNEWIDIAIEDVTKYLSMPYNDARYEYYRRVNTAETLKFNLQQQGVIYSLTDNNIICELIIAIGDALTYRMESYICSPTILHVVRILQASKDKQEKYKTVTPDSYCDGAIRHIDAYCAIGPFGYIISMLEQIGYIERFKKTYCDRQGNPGHYNEDKCAKKQKKYQERLQNGIINFDKFLKKRGGRRKAIRKNQLHRTKKRKRHLRRGTRCIRKRRAFN